LRRKTWSGVSVHLRTEAFRYLNCIVCTARINDNYIPNSAYYARQSIPDIEFLIVGHNEDS